MSLSPSKNSQPATSSPDRLYYGSSPEHAAQHPVSLSPSPHPQTMENTVQSETSKVPARGDIPTLVPASPTRSPVRLSTNTMTLSRSSTLSWQQRPSSRDSDTPRSRPLSRHTDVTASTSAKVANEGRTREQIALSLSSKDPSWFRQTADRGTSSDAYNKRRQELQFDVGQTSHRLPGLSQHSSTDPEKPPSSFSKDRSRSPSQSSSAADTNSWGNRFSSMSSQSTVGGPNPSLPTKSSLRLIPPVEGLNNDQVDTKRSGSSSLQDQLSRDKPASPTKGLGGFVQSAMMKRSDSVNKRWSAQGATGLSRGNSTASYRGAIGHSVPVSEGPESPPRVTASSFLGLATSPSAKSRPNSSHSTSTVLHHTESTSLSSFPSTFTDQTGPKSSHPSSGKDSPSHESGSKQQERKQKSPVLQPHDALPVSSTKTMDPKRWSPTKASWLESALARPESPKLTSPKPQTPSWMTDLQRSKLSKEESDSVKSPASSFTSVSAAGLMRSPPHGSHLRPLSIGGLAEGPNSGLTREVSLKKPQDAIVEENPVAHPSFSAGVNLLSTSPTKSSSDHPASPDLKAVSMIAGTKEMPLPRSTLDEKHSFSPKAKPPKIDFRASLRPRQNTSEESASTETEFKNVFGKLKRAQTKNYVAPNELKDNILRGKAALNLTGGPQRVKKVDDFKESILERKESLKAEASRPIKDVCETGRSITALQKSAAPTEPFANKSNLKKRTNSTQTSPTNNAQCPTPGISSSLPSFQDQSNPGKEAVSLEGVGRYNIQAVTPESQEQEPHNIEPAFANSRSAIRATNKLTMVNSPLPAAKPPFTASGTTEQITKKTPSGKLASRLNPNLVNCLSRYPKSVASGRNPSGDNLSSTGNMGSPSTVQELEESSTGVLTHATKARARGPRRRLPNAAASLGKPKDSPTEFSQTVMLEEALHKPDSREPVKEAVSQGAVYDLDKDRGVNIAPRPLSKLINNNDKVAQTVVANKKPVFPGSADQNAQHITKERLSDAEFKENARPTVAAKSPMLRKVSLLPPSTSAAAAANPDRKPLPSQEQLSEHAKPGSQDEQGNIGASIADMVRHADVGQLRGSASTSSTIPQKYTASMQRVLPNPESQVKNKNTSASADKPMLRGLGLKLPSGKFQPPDSQLTPPEESCSMAMDSRETLVEPQGKDASKIQEPIAQQVGTEVDDLLTSFFDEKPKITDKAEIDAQVMILNRPSGNTKSKVLKTQIWQINADGKRENPSPKQEHILFEECIYLCVHSFETPTGSVATEVYLWCGDAVSEAAFEDAQLFCRREARENNTKLELLRQGKEPANFFQALGGIVITRRSRTSALYILCGRRHLGHIAFDEVDLDPAYLCSAFPYIISATSGKIFLWKGKASGVDEVGCARLIGMDLSLTGEIEEVEEGEVPSSLLEVLGGSMKLQDSQQWSVRSRSDHYECRLFRVELEQTRGMSGFWTRRGSSPAKVSKASVQEIHPFCQRDLNSRCIFVLDAYFNIFV